MSFSSIAQPANNPNLHVSEFADNANVGNATTPTTQGADTQLSAASLQTIT